MIERIDGFSDAYNPIQDHIKIQFCKAETDIDKLDFISNELLNQGFDPLISRCLIFVNSRKKCEQLTASFEEIINEGWKEGAIQNSQVGFYHAGMEAEDRQGTYSKFKEGEIVLLFATKAFGMGMDIKNIHFLFHFSPPGTFEDYLQEVGRAGRNEEARLRAGFQDGKRITATCLYSSNDFTKMKSRLHDSRLGWNHIKQTKDLVENYIKSIRGHVQHSTEPVAIPFNLRNTNASKPNEKEDVKFRLALHWLECLNRIELGYFTVTHFDFETESLRSLKSKDFSSADSDQQELLKALATFSSLDRNGPAVQISISILRSKLKCSLEKLMSGLVKAHKSAWIKLIQKTAIYYPEYRAKEVGYCNGLSNSDQDKYLGIKVIFDLARQILNQVSDGESQIFRSEDLNSMFFGLLEPYNDLEKLPWSEEQYHDRQKKEIQRYIKALKTMASKHVFSLLQCLDKIRHTSNFDSGESSISGKPFVYQVVSSGYHKTGQVEIELKSLENHCVNLISFITNENLNSGKTTFIWADLFKESAIGLPDNLNYFLNLLMICSKSGYLFHTGLFPSGIEVYLKNTAEINDLPDLKTPDGEVFADFNEVAKSRELKLIALQSLQEISGKEGPTYAQQDEFIKAYFRCSSSQDLVRLLEEKLGDGHSAMAAYRAESYKEEIRKLNDEQKLVFNFPLNKNLNVIAGPGSGKTHTLVLRIARFIQDQNVAPSEILVLAYNRAVVSELKDRLGKLFRALGYHQLIER